MDKIMKYVTLCLDLLFPRNPCELLCDRLSVFDLEMLVGSNGSIYFYDCIAPLPYSHTYVKNTIHAMKYYGHRSAPVLLAQAIAPVIIEELSELRMFGSFHEALLIPIPLHATRYKERGFNQSERICSELHNICKDSGITMCSTVLIRNKKTTPQAQHSSKDARIKNIRNAFAVANSTEVQGKDILLLDDVVTTGTTLQEAKRTLRDAGARNITCIAVAH